MDGEVWAGPNAVPSIHREGYGRASIRFRDAWELLGYPGTWHLARRYWRTGSCRDLACRRQTRGCGGHAPLSPGAHRRATSLAGSCGIRAQVLARDGTPARRLPVRAPWPRPPRDQRSVSRGHGVDGDRATHRRPSSAQPIEGRRCVVDSGRDARRRPGSRSASAPGPSSAAARPAPSRRAPYGNHGTISSAFPRSIAESIFFATRSGPITNGRPSGVERIFGCGNPGVVTNPGMIVCTSTPVPRSEARSERENATWAYFDAEYGAAGVNTIAPAVDAIVAMWERPARPRCLPEPVEQAAGHPDAAEVVDDERPLDLVERGVDEAAARRGCRRCSRAGRPPDAARGCAPSSRPPPRGRRRRRSRSRPGRRARRRGAGARPRGARRARSASPGARAAGPSPGRCPTRRR